MPRIGLTRDKVIRTAAMLANERGLSAVTITTLAEYLGIKKPSLYNHVKSQEDIYYGIMVYGWTEGAQVIVDEIDDDEPKEALKAYARKFYDYAVNNKGIFDAMLWYNKYDSEELIQATEKIYEFFFRQTDKLGIDRTVANHILRTYRSFLEGFVLLVNHKSFSNPIPIDESFEISLDVLISGMEQYER